MNIMIREGKVEDLKEMNPLFVARAMETLMKVIRIREYLENQKKQCTFAVFKKNKSINRSTRNIKKKIMDIKKIANELCVEVYATNNEETTIIIRKIIGETGVHETYMDIYDKLMNTGKNVKWDVKMIQVRSLKSIYYNVSKEEEV